MSKKRKFYTKEFKIESVKLTNALTATQVSKDLGISENSLSNWKKESFLLKVFISSSI